MRYATLDLSALPTPAIIEQLSYDAIKVAMVQDLIARDPDFTALLESDPAIKVLEVCAYRELLLRQRINDACGAVMLARAIGTNLDNLAAFYGTLRMTQVINNQTVVESDDRLRMRTQLALESLSCAGPVGAYLYQVFSLSLRIADVSAFMSSPGTVRVSVYTIDNGGIPDQTLLNQVIDRLGQDDIRPLTDVVNVQPASIVHFSVAATIRLYPGPDSASVQAAVTASVNAYLLRVRRLGFSVTLSDLYGAITQPGVQGSTITSPSQDLVLDETQISVCDSVTITVSPTRLN